MPYTLDGFQMTSTNLQSSERPRIVVAITCHNRRELSCRLVRSLQDQATEDFEMSIVAVDDGSTDGTGQALNALGVNVLKGDGNLYWAGGMRKAHARASRMNPDIILWLNDDLDLRSNALQLLMASYKETKGQAILVGNVIAASSGDVAYGGRCQNPSNPLSFLLSEHNIGSYAVDTFNGNFVAIPRIIYSRVGFPAGYKHAYADLAYGILASKQGYQSQTIPEPVGTNDRNPQTGRMFRDDLSLAKRVKFAVSPFGLPPLQQWRFAVLTTGFAAPYWFVRSYARVFLPSKTSHRLK